MPPAQPISLQPGLKPASSVGHVLIHKLASFPLSTVKQEETKWEGLLCIKKGNGRSIKYLKSAKTQKKQLFLNFQN